VNLIRYVNLRIISDRDEIESQQKRLENILKERADKVVEGGAGFQGGEAKGKVYWMSDLSMWYMTRIEGNRYWNSFGTEEPEEGSNRTIVCEINFPLESINRRVGAAIARDPTGNYYVVHRGKLGGNYSKRIFEENYRGEWTTVVDGDREENVVVIGKIDETIPEKIRDFVYEVQRIKGMTADFNLKEKLQKILDEYGNARKEGFSGHPLAGFIRTELPNELRKIAPADYTIKGSAGQISWAKMPWIAIMDPEITDTPQKGFYLVYLFKENMEGVYLSLAQGVPEINNKYKRILKKRAEALRSHINNGNYLNEISLGKRRYAPLYEAGNIIAKYYPSGELPDDDELQSDLEEFLKIYRELKPVYEDLEENFNEETDLSQHPGRGKGTDFYRYLQSLEYYFSPEIVENFLLSLRVKPFVILTGNSGTGKTKLAQLYGQYISTDKRRYLVVPVGANWTETRHIFGYLNIMTGKYQSTPALEFIMSANKDPDNPYILILDEMNLSHVERYFSDFLSAIESGEPVPLHDAPERDVPSEIKIPENLRVVGTVNVDETTYMFSPKVLDRANTIEFETLKPGKYLEGNPHDQGLAGDVEFLENIIEYSPEQLEVLKDELPIWNKLVEELDFFHETLRAPGFDFGFRVTLEILRFMHAAWIYEKKPGRWENWERYMDAQIKQKILPKIHGPERLLRDTLEELREHCRDRFPESEKKLEEMQNTLKTQRYASFIR
jgi:5-methylcytosine-specific restriction endonuclease McrBC GTP-binding regulatory subunit McrB